MHLLKTMTPLVAFVALALAGCGQKPEPATPSPRLPGDTPEPLPMSGDRDKLQGTWAIESVDFGRPQTDPDSENRMKSVRLEFEGDKFTSLEGASHSFTFTLDETQNPKVLAITELRDAGSVPARATHKRTGELLPARKPRHENWIYKFEGDNLIVAFIKDGGGEKPAEFKARPQFGDDGPHAPSVLVITLKKTDAPVPAGTPPRVGTEFTPSPATRK